MHPIGYIFLKSYFYLFLISYIGIVAYLFYKSLLAYGKYADREIKMM
jgi:hypothetical protein